MLLSYAFFFVADMLLLTEERSFHARLSLFSIRRRPLSITADITLRFSDASMMLPFMPLCSFSSAAAAFFAADGNSHYAYCHISAGHRHCR